MNANEVMKDSINQLAEGLEGADESKQKGFKGAVSVILEKVKNEDSTEFIPYAITKSYETFNHAEDLKDEEADSNDILFAEGEYEAYEGFLGNFNT
jgi:hypothetical protein